VFFHELAAPKRVYVDDDPPLHELAVTSKPPGCANWLRAAAMRRLGRYEAGQNAALSPAWWRKPGTN